MTAVCCSLILPMGAGGEEWGLEVLSLYLIPKPAWHHSTPIVNHCSSCINVSPVTSVTLFCVS